MPVTIINIRNTANNKSFNVYLTRESWFSYEGKWTCLPGYLKVTDGVFSYNTKYSTLNLSTKNITFMDTFYILVADPSLEERSDNHPLYLSLDEFSPDLGIGDNGFGSIFNFGSKGMEMMKEHGYDCSQIKWEIKELC